MKCDESGEYLSALCDGEQIPREAAEHIGKCVACRERMHEYLEIGAELRREASLQIASEVAVHPWERNSCWYQKIWQKGWETMRIPRVAFAAIVVVLLAMSFGVAHRRVRAHASGSMLLINLEITGHEGSTFRCILKETDSNKPGCVFSTMQQGKPVAMEVDYQGKDGDGVRLAIRSLSQIPNSMTGDFETLREKMQSQTVEYVSFQPGEAKTLHLAAISALVELHGEWTNYIPAHLDDKELLSPKEGLLRIYIPLLIRDHKLLNDFGDVVATTNGRIELYGKQRGHLIISLQPKDEFIEAQAENSRITFKTDGHEYELVAGAPMTQATTVWVRLDWNYKASGGEGGSITAYNASGK